MAPAIGTSGARDATGKTRLAGTRLVARWLAGCVLQKRQRQAAVARA